MILFLFTYLPQVAFLAIFQRRGSAWLNGTFLVLSESNLIVVLFFEAFFVDKTQVDLVDAVLVGRGHADLVRTLRTVDDQGENELNALGPRDKGAEYAPFSFRQVVELFLLLPLNLVPYVGVPLFLLGTGYRAGPLQQWRYFQLKAFDKKQRKAYLSVKSHKWQMMWFGTVSLLLQLIPVVSLLFLLTTAVGTGLWAADIEDGRQNSQEEETPGEQYAPFTDED